MYDIKKANKFDGIRAIMSEEEYNKTISCLQVAAGISKKAGDSQFADACDKTFNVLTKMSYFDLEEREARLQIGYNELSIITQALSMFLPDGEIDLDFDLCSMRPEAKIWQTKSTETE